MQNNNFKNSLSKILLIICGFCLVNQIADAQVKNSVYTMFGIGQLTDNTYGVNRALGGTGIAFQSGGLINYLNPASYLGISSSFIMEIGIYGIYNKSENKSTSQNAGNINMNYFSCGIYITKWWAASFGLTPLSYIDYEINSSSVVEGDNSTFKKNFKGTGGLNRIYFGNSFQILRGLTVGFNTSYVLGHITHTETAFNENNSTETYELVNKRNAYNLYMDYGLQYTTNINNNWLYTVGFIYSAGKKLNTDNDLLFTYNSTTTSLKAEEQSDIKIPEKTGLGISIKNDKHFKAGLDYERENWSNIRFLNSHIQTVNSSKLSAGIEYSPSDKINDSWYRSVIYRFGANYKTAYFKLNNTGIKSEGINFGIGIPYNMTNTINLSLEYGQEGTLDKGLIKNSYWLLYLNFSLHDIWSNFPDR